MTLPNALKPALFLLVILTMILGGASSPEKGHSFSGGWFFWLNTIVQLIFLIVVIGFFLLEIERLMTCGRDSWPIAEMVYSGVFFVCNIVNIFITANWHGVSTNGTPVAAALASFALAILYALGGVMMYRIWRGIVKAGVTQNPTGSTQPGNIQGMHPGI
uniref:MARVEL domain-containing protein n=1 Tax=Panagrellus redivivus TaxID=6233 RepID=A0A7E4VRM6_PANRE